MEGLTRVARSAPDRAAQVRRRAGPRARRQRAPRTTPLPRRKRRRRGRIGDGSRIDAYGCSRSHRLFRLVVGKPQSVLIPRFRDRHERRMIFVNSMSDLFHERSCEYIAQNLVADRDGPTGRQPEREPDEGARSGILRADPEVAARLVGLPTVETSVRGGEPLAGRRGRRHRHRELAPSRCDHSDARP